MTFYSRINAHYKVVSTSSLRHEVGKGLVVNKTMEHIREMRKALDDGSVGELRKAINKAAKDLILYCANAPAPVREVMLKVRKPHLLPLLDLLSQEGVDKGKVKEAIDKLEKTLEAI